MSTFRQFLKSTLICKKTLVSFVSLCFVAVYEWPLNNYNSVTLVLRRLGYIQMVANTITQYITLQEVCNDKAKLKDNPRRGYNTDTK